MKTRNLIQLAAMFLAVMSISVAGCKKDNLSNGNSDSSTLVQLSTDENNMEVITDDALKDVENVLAYQGGGLKSTEFLPCHATIDSAAVVNDSITLFITYNGLNCAGTRNIVGKIEVKKKVGTHWGQEGATILMKYVDFTVTKVATGKTTIFNGNKTFENVSGGFIWQLGTTRTSVVDRVSGNMTITFDDGATRQWNIARQRTFTGTPGSLLMTNDGFGTSGQYSNLVTWGTNRNGEEFYTQISQSVVHKQLCDWNPVSGIKIHQIPAQSKSATITFGFDDNNEPVTGDVCPTRYRIDWQNGTHSGTKYVELP